MLKQQSHIVAPIPDELRTRALYTVNELRERGKADKIAIDKLFELIVEMLSLIHISEPTRPY